ncbi:hypothetical protein L228DRAFT_268664 [Xylona heveae TC161]|uniref:DNA recombination and repair protein Rad51-like C-terminal domain-containing protein n=1 Tax=Xylona heveae (strain CBS 132557 / TC161) TaxID=1328760 RepID=A0A165GH63_XYLHT|nr:hypothetical protein L228DRAFT_268664 [Xylona heveae TC161]KZF22179.1 hypothetical protein L228DRAFT_268664 [Xylona heveae TC161]
MANDAVQPASPILGHVLLEIEEEKEAARLRNRSDNSTNTGSRIGTGCCSAIDDEVLDGGFDYGSIAALSGGLLRQDGRGTLIALHTLANHLLQNPLSDGVVIDTTGGFDVLFFAGLLRARLESESVLSEHQHQHQHVDAKINTVLDRVKVMGVFDFFGVIEAVDELSAVMRLDIPTHPEVRGDAPAFKTEDAEDTVFREVGEVAGKAEIADSQDEDDEGEDEEMESEKEHHTPEFAEPGASTEQNATGHRNGIGMIIIDNIVHVVSPMMKNDHVQAHGLLMPFLRSLRHLTHDYDICTILLNSIVLPQTQKYPYPHQRSTPSAFRSDEESFTFHAASRGQIPKNNHGDFDDNDDDDGSRVSIFASTPGKPALGKSFAHCVDTHLFLSRVPKGIRDAEVVYAGSRSNGHDAQMVDVIEVLDDRNSARQGRWSAFVVDEFRILNAF